MAELWVISNLFREKCEENPETQHLCQEIATQYTDSQKMELRDHFAREENLRLKLEIGNLESMSNCVSDNNEVQAELDTLLHECYKQHMKVCFDMDECEMEKLYSYDSIKFELESRDTIHFYQQLYLRKIKTATKMESRNIVKKYRQKERELAKSQDGLLTAEKSLRELEDNVKKSQQELQELILRLVKGSKELEIIYSRSKNNQYGLPNTKDANAPENTYPPGTMERSKAFHKPVHKGGLSARLSVGWNRFKIPSASVLPRIRAIDPTKSRNRLLQQAADLRKSMQESTIVQKDVEPTPKLSSILKTPGELATPIEGPRKTVSFEKDLSQTISISNTTSNTFPSCNQMEMDTGVPEIPSDFDMKQNLVEKTKAKEEKQSIQIIENIVLKPADVLQTTVVPHLSVELHSKRKMQISGDSSIFNSPSKKKRSAQDTGNTSIEVGSNNFMDMFLELSKDTTSASVEERTTNDELKEILSESIAETTINKDKLRENKREDESKVHKQQKSFEDFEDFVSGFANTSSDDINKNHFEAELSFDFGGDNDDGNAGCDNFSLNF